MKFQVNQPLVPMKAHYFLFNAGTGPVVPYLSVYARQLGFSSIIVGLIYTILPVCGMIAKPIFGALADRFHCQKIIFLTAQLLTAVAFLSIFYAPKVPNEDIVNFSCRGGEAVFGNVKDVTVDGNMIKKIQNKPVLTRCELTCDMSAEHLDMLCTNWTLASYRDNSSYKLMNVVTFSAMVPLSETEFFEKTTIIQGRNVSNGIVRFRAVNFTQNGTPLNTNCSDSGMKSTCLVSCNDNDVSALMLRVELPDAKVYGTYQFWVFLILMITAWCGQAVTVSIGDAICFEMLGDKPNRYGYQRMYGALGWGILSLLTGILVDIISKDSSTIDYSICFYLAATFLILDFLVSSRLKYDQVKLSVNIFKDVGKLLMNVRIIVFLVWCVCVGMCTGLLWQFLLWLVEDLAKGRGETRIKTLQGVIMGVQCLGGELPFFFLSGKILKKIGHVTAMSVVLFTLGLRFVIYSVIDNPWYFIPIELTNGLTFGLFYACMASYASIVAPTGTEATMQGMVGAVFEGVGVSLGSFLAGLTMSSVSGSMTFRYFGFGALATCGLHLVVQYLLQAKGNDKLQPQTKFETDTSVVVVARKNSFEKVRLDDEQELSPVDPLILR